MYVAWTVCRTFIIPIDYYFFDFYTNIVASDCCIFIVIRFGAEW